MTLSFSDWLKHAARADDAAEAARCVDEAVAMAKDGWYWAKIMDVVGVLPPARVRELADRALAAALAEPDLWCFRKVARVRATILGDRSGAFEALELAVLAFLDQPRASSWGMLAKGFVELGDAAGARRCLDHGCEQARRAQAVDHLARLARDHAELGDRAEAIARAEEAEAMMFVGDGHGAWALAGTWEELGDGDAARRVLERATDLAMKTGDALTVARAWAHHGGAVGQPRAFDRAAELAETADHWIAIAGAAHDLAQPARVRAMLEHALDAADGDADARARVAAAYVQWLGDHAAADAIGARGWRPEALLDAPAPALAGWAADPAGLFDWLRARASRAQLERIARADYGMDFDRHLAAVADPCATGLVPRQLAWHPGEVLALTRWNEGEGVDHLVRALAVTLLCLGDQADLESNGAILVESALALGAEPAALAAGLVVWCDGSHRAAWARMKFPDGHSSWALVTLAVLAAAIDPDEPRIADVVARLAAHESRGDLPRELTRSVRRALWLRLLDRHVRPHAARVPALAALLACLEPP